MKTVRSPFEVLREPIENVLRRNGIAFKTRTKGGVTWYNLAKCPACGHGRKGNEQCGIAESRDSRGKLTHGMRCFHPHDNRWGSETPPYVEVLVEMGELTPEEADKVRDYQNKRVNPAPAPKPIPRAKKIPRVNPETLAAYQRRLEQHAGAMSYLTRRGLDAQTINHFALGLSKPYKNKEGLVQQNALNFPVLDERGNRLKRFAYYNIPGITENPLDANGWMAGEVMTYYGNPYAGQTSVMVLEGMKDVWRTQQALRESTLPKDLLLITSTHGRGFPAEWRSLEFWSRFETIYLGHDNDEPGDKMALALAEMVGQSAHRVLVPKAFGKDWTDFWQKRGIVAQFEQLLEAAPEVSLNVIDDEEGKETAFGRQSYDPIDINGAYHGGYLYYPIQILHRTRELVEDEQGIEHFEVQERLETVVVRSDRKFFGAYTPPAGKGARTEERVTRLTDGTLIREEPKPNQYGTWSWHSIQAYINGERGRPLGEILGDIQQHLRGSVWLPYEEDYALLSLLVPVTYAQEIFDAVPLLLLNGSAGSGKSQMGLAMASICANGQVVGQVSPAAIARLINEARGFVVLDDLEAIGSLNKRNNTEFSELVQYLKVSYNKATAVKHWFDMKSGRNQRLNFYGVKMVNNTTGVDAILGTRMLQIRTRTMPASARDEFAARPRFDPLRIEALRQEMHTWVFAHVGEIATTYRKIYPSKSDRQEEITAPLKVFADMAGDQTLSSDLEIALGRQAGSQANYDDPIQVLFEAVNNLVARGHFSISITHLVLEMRSLVDANYGQTSETEIPEWAQPNWVGRQLRSLDIVEHGVNARRERIFGKSLRVYPVRNGYIEDYFTSHPDVQRPEEPAEPMSFCRGCASCPYQFAGCEIQEQRQIAEGRSAAKAPRTH